NAPRPPGGGDHARPPRPSRRGDHGRGDRVAALGGLRPGREPAARAARAGGADPGGSGSLMGLTPARGRTVPEYLRSVVDTLRQLDGRSTADILLLTVLIWWLLLLVRGTTAMSLLRGAAIVLFTAFVLARIFDLTVINWLLRNSLPGLVLGVLIIFQPEI